MQKIGFKFNQIQAYSAILSQFYLEILPFLLMGFGALVRVVQYLSNRSLWADEAVLALNIVHRSYRELLQPLDYDQAAPLGFLFIEKLAVQLLGNTEYALRLFPLFCGILSLLLFYQLSQQYLPKAVMPVGLLLFASSDALIYYSSEVKQYASDVAITLLLSVLMVPLFNSKLTQKRILILAAVGGIAPWFSHAAILVLAGIGFSTILIRLFGNRVELPNPQKKNLELIPLTIIFSTWLLSFIIFYLVCLSQFSTSGEDLLNSWKDAFPSSPFDLLWFFDAWGKFFYKPLGFGKWTDGFAILAFIMGCISYYSRKKSTLLRVLCPLLFTFLAAYLHQYPFRSRLVLFLVPFFILLMAEGVNAIRLKLPQKPLPVILGLMGLLWLTMPPFFQASYLLLEPAERSEIKPILSYIKSHQQPGDVLYIYQRGIYQFQYYAEKYGYKPGDYILGVDDLDKQDGKKVSEEERRRYQQDLEQLRGKPRVWLIFANATIPAENRMIKSYLNEMGTKRDEVEKKGAFVYLYDLSGR